jgi:hypothetical protein
MFMKTRDTALAQLSATLVAGAAPAAPEAIATAPR